MNIFFLSVTDHLNEDLRLRLKKEISERGNLIAYISSEPQDANREYYYSTVEDYVRINNDIKVDYFDLSENFSDDDLQRLLNYKTIYLSGGNTYVFMDAARKRNILPILKKHLGDNGLLIGASAGAIMMAPSIDLAGIEDENIPQTKDTSGFNFVNFEFHPHFKEEDKSFLDEYTKNRGVGLYVCKDGDGIFYSNGKMTLFGETVKW